MQKWLSSFIAAGWMSFSQSQRKRQLYNLNEVPNLFNFNFMIRLLHSFKIFSELYSFCCHMQMVCDFLVI